MWIRLLKKKPISEKEKVAHYDLTQSYTVSGGEGQHCQSRLRQVQSCSVVALFRTER